MLFRGDVQTQQLYQTWADVAGIEATSVDEATAFKVYMTRTFIELYKTKHKTCTKYILIILLTSLLNSFFMLKWYNHTIHFLPSRFFKKFQNYQHQIQSKVHHHHHHPYHQLKMFPPCVRLKIWLFWSKSMSISWKLER